MDSMILAFFDVDLHSKYFPHLDLNNGKEFEIFASGFRNIYGGSLNKDGELFTYDADMEWDLGTPWYRPTRINHVVSGSEFGWRAGTGK